MTEKVYRAVAGHIAEGKTVDVSALMPSDDEGNVSDVEITLAALENSDSTDRKSVTFEKEADGKCILNEEFSAPERLIILGGGHVSLAVCDMAHFCGFYVIAVDDRPEFADPERFRNADEVKCGGFGEMIDEIKPRQSDYFLIVTRGHAQDTDCIKALFRYPESKYTGLMGSHKRTAALRKTLADAGLDAGRLERIHMPVGLPIGAENVYEIAVSIVAQLIEVRRKGSDRKRVLPDHDKNVLEILAKETKECAVAEIVSTEGSSPRGAGARMIVYKDGSIKGTIGGGEAEGIIIDESRKLIGTGRYRILKIDRYAEAELSKGKVCGGTVTVLICDLI